VVEVVGTRVPIVGPDALPRGPDSQWTWIY
jgi:hypothetical protein